MKFGRALIILLVFDLAPCSSTAKAVPPNTPLSIDQCVEIALGSNPLIEEAEAKVEEYRARLAEVEAIFYPKLTGMAYVAPMFTVRGSAFDREVEYKWKDIGNWRPYTHFEAVLAQPLYTFGRVAAGELAASERVEVERARLREARNVVALEVRKLYYNRLFALSMLPSLDNAAEIVAGARKEARELYDSASGKVTQTDLMKLRYAAIEVDRYRILAREGAQLALSALKHTMGISEKEEIRLVDERLPRLPPQEVADLYSLLKEASINRPEWIQIKHGIGAAEAWADAERKALWPVVFLGGMLRVEWAPTRDDASNPYHYDPYNEIVGGVALGLIFDLDPARTIAKTHQAEATRDQIEALRKFASTGIPLQVLKARTEVQRYRCLSGLSTDSVKSTRKWMTFAATAYATGTGETSDLVEGMVAYLQSKRAYYEDLLGFHIACAELDYAVGKENVSK
ncbi:MAG: TolC family protein [Deltaproteobacteria bacterium]|nr:TolC family protein [Deltaproteobacteria bacterium]